MTASPIFKGSAQRGLDFSFQARNPGSGWRYGVKAGETDTSVTAWMAAGIAAAIAVNRDAQDQGRPAPLTVDPGAVPGALAWVDSATDFRTGHVGYPGLGDLPARELDFDRRFPPHESASTTAAGTMIRIFAGEDPAASRLVAGGARLLWDRLPVWDVYRGSNDFAYWFWGSMASPWIGGRFSREWNDALELAVVRTQRTDGTVCEFLGSWDPVDPWGAEGGRVAATALLALALQQGQESYGRVNPWRR
jgi:hypothetical protein